MGVLQAGGFIMSEVPLYTAAYSSLHRTHTQYVCGKPLKLYSHRGTYFLCLYLFLVSRYANEQAHSGKSITARDVRETNEYPKVGRVHFSSVRQRISSLGVAVHPV